MEIPDLEEIQDPTRESLQPPQYLGINNHLLKTNVALRPQDFKNLHMYLNLLLCYKLESRINNPSFLEEPNPFYSFAKEIATYNCMLDVLKVGYSGVFYPLVHGNNVITAPWSKISLPYLFLRVDDEVSPDLSYSVQGIAKLLYFHHIGEEITIPLKDGHIATPLYSKKLDCLEHFMHFFYTKKNLHLAYVFLNNRLFYLSQSDKSRRMLRDMAIPKLPIPSFDLTFMSKYNTIVYEHLKFVRTSVFSPSYRPNNKPPTRFTRLFSSNLSNLTFETVIMEEEFNCVPAFRKLFYMPIDDFIDTKLRYASQKQLLDYKKSDIFMPYIVYYTGFPNRYDPIELPPAPVTEYDQIDIIDFFRHLELSKNVKVSRDLPKIYCVTVFRDGRYQLITKLTEQYKTNALLLPDGKLAFHGNEFEIAGDHVASPFFYENRWPETFFDFDFHSTMAVNRLLAMRFLNNAEDFAAIITTTEDLEHKGYHGKSNNTNRDPEF